MAQVVEYILSLKDQLSGGIQNANTHVNQLEGSVGSARSALGSLTGMLGTLGVGFAIFKGAAFVHDGVEAFHKIEQSMAQVEAGLHSTGGAAGMTKESISDMAKEMSSRMKFGRADILDMQAQMLTFGGITKENFPAIGDAIANVATKIGMDLHGMSIQFGKAMDNPADGIKKLMRQGVMFSQQQEDAIDKLVEKGNIVGAQQIMLAEIANKYGGASKAAFDADPLSRFNKEMGSIKVGVGELATDLLKKLVPALEWFSGTLKASFVFIKEHKELLKDIAIVLGIAGGAYLIYQTIIYALALPIKILTAVQYAWNIAVSANPIVIAIAAIVALIAVVVLCWKHFVEFRAVTMGLWEGIKEFGTGLGNVFLGIGEVISGALTINPAKVLEGYNQITNSMAGMGKKIGEAYWKGHDGVIKEDADSKLEKKGLAPAVAKKAAVVGAPPPDAKTKATGSKSITINVSIKDLIGTQNINTTTLKEGAGKIQEMIANALAGAVNDFQIIAGGH